MINAYYFEFLALCVAIFSYAKLKNSFMVWFIPFLLFTFISEISSDIIYRKYGLATDWIYNILSPLTIVFYGYIFYSFIDKKKFKHMFLFAGLIYLLINIYVVLTSSKFNITLLIIGALIQIILSCYYFYSCLLNDIDLNSYKVKSGLWIASGVLVFFAGISIVYSLLDFIREHHLNIGGVALYNFVPRCLSIILYTCISIALLKWKKPQEI
nr:hypothetical protein [Pseudopedobacter sp.]